MCDFTIKIYKKLLITLQQAGYEFLTFEQYCSLSAGESSAGASFIAGADLQSVPKTYNTPITNRREQHKKLPKKFIILRHDVDSRAANSLETAKIEHSLGICASYYFRVVPQSNKPQIIKQIADLRHEIGYHYEELSHFKGDEHQAITHFEKNLAYFRKFYPVRTICMHGNPVSKIDNKNIWKSINYNNFGIIGEPYIDIDFNKIFYLTDTGRSWNGERFNVWDKVQTSYNQHFRTTKEIINAAYNSTLPNQIMMTMHPQRWTNNPVLWLWELLFQSLKNKIKQVLIFFVS